MATTVWRLGAAVILAAWVAGCGGNSTPVGVTVAPPGTATAPFSVLLGVPQQFIGTVGGSTTTGVTWEICLPAATPTTLPTNCNNSMTNPLTGFGTINTNGLYTPPATLPNPDLFNIVAISVANPKIFGISFVKVVSGVRVQIAPTAPPTIGTNETFQFTATVTGANNPAFSWTVSGNGETNVPGGDANTGTITPSGLFTASSTAGAITLTATSAQDPSQSASINVTVVLAMDPDVASIDPPAAVQGSIQQDVFVTGSNFLSTSTALVSTTGKAKDGVAVTTTFIGSTTLRATIPFSGLTGVPPAVQIFVQRQNGDQSVHSATLTLNPLRPAIVAVSPEAVTQTSSPVNVNLIGGYFSPAVAGFFNGQSLGAITVSDPRQALASIPGAALGAPGLYPIVLQNSLISPPAANMSAINLAVEPASSSLPSSPANTVSVGSAPSAIAIDAAAGSAVVANTGDGSVSIVDLATSAVTTISGVGAQLTGIAVDDQLPHHLALVVDSANNDLVVIDLSVPAVTGTVSLAAFTPPGSAPFSIAINPLTHRAFVANTSTNEGTVIDLVNPTPNSTPPCNTAPCPIAAVGPDTIYSTGPTPSIAVDPRVNWVVVAPGGVLPVSIVDLGRAPSPGDGGRAPVLVSAFLPGTTVQGVAVDTETHKVLLTTPTQTTLTTFSLLDQSVGSVVFSTTQLNLVAAAINPLSSVGIAVNNLGNSAVIVDMENNVPLGSVSLPSNPQAVAVDPGTSVAAVANTGANSVSLVSLGGIRDPHIVEASPAIALAPAVTNLALNIVGHGFLAGSGTTVLLDGIPVPTTVVSDRQISATVPAAMLASARRYIVAVQNSLGLSNVTDLTVIQPVEVGNGPFGVAVDTDRDIAAVTNAGDDTLSFVDLKLGTVIGTPTPVGTSPQGVAMIPRLGLALVANFGSNNTSIVNEAGGASTTVPLCGSCFGPVGVAVNQDTLTAAVTDSIQNSSGTVSRVSFLTLPSASAATLGASPQTDQDAVAVAIDPALNLAAVAVEFIPSLVLPGQPQQGGLDIGTINSGPTSRVALTLPTGVIFDPVNQVFLAADSLSNEIAIVDPANPSLTVTTVPASVDPTSLDYNFQTSTLVTVNSTSNTLSLLDYVCPPTTSGGGVSGCPAPRVQATLGLNSSQSFSTLLQFAVAVDPALHLAVVVDTANNRILLVPLH